MNQQYKGRLEWQKRYAEAHYRWSEQKHPNVVADGYYTLPKFPDVKTANGLTQFVVNFLDWSGCYGNRINTVGRVIKQGRDIHTAGGGIIKAKQIMIKSSTKKGTADINGIIGGSDTTIGIPCHIEIKVGRDTQKEDQKKQEKQVNSVGGLYTIVKTVDEFLYFYDKVMAMPKISKMF